MLLGVGLGTAARPLRPQQQAGRGPGCQIIQQPPRSTERTERTCPQNDHTSTQETAVENYEDSPHIREREAPRGPETAVPYPCQMPAVTGARTGSGVQVPRNPEPAPPPARGRHPPERPEPPQAATPKGEGQGPPQQHRPKRPRATTHPCRGRVSAERHAGQPHGQEEPKQARGSRSQDQPDHGGKWRWLAPSSMAPTPPARSHPGTKATTTPPQSSCTQIPRGTAQPPTVSAHKGRAEMGHCATPRASPPAHRRETTSPEPAAPRPWPPLLPELLAPPAEAKGGDSGMRLDWGDPTPQAVA